MAKYAELVAQLLEDGKITKEEHDQLVDLSAAKEAIKEFNSVKAERDDLAAFKAKIDTAPKRKEALKRVGVDYDAQPRFAQKFLDSLDEKTLNNAEKLAEVIKEEGFEANLSNEQQPGDTGAERITQATVNLGTGAPQRIGEAARQQAFLEDLDKVPDGDKNAMNEVLAKHGMQPATEG